MLIELKNQIDQKQKIENRINELEKEMAKEKREISNLNMQLNENISNLNKIEKSIFIFNKENKIIELEEIIRKIKSKLKVHKYQLNLNEIELNRLNVKMNDINAYEIEYEKELNYQISLLNSCIKDEYLQIIKDNQEYKNIIDEGSKIIECLKKMEFFYNRGANYHTVDKRYTLGDTTWILGSPKVDVYNLHKEIYRFENSLEVLNSSN